MIKYIDEPAKFLIDTGLLFRINREILHPLGMALYVQCEDDGSNPVLAGLIDCRDDPEGFIFENGTFLDGKYKADAFMASQSHKLDERANRLGYVIQPEPPPK